jgi:hypothetical protein
MRSDDEDDEEEYEEENEEDEVGLGCCNVPSSRKGARC